MAKLIHGLFHDSLPLRNKDAGVYAIINRVSGKMYIGATVSLARRRRVHKYDFRNHIHSAHELQREIDLKPDDFEMSVIEWVSDSEKLKDREKFWLDFYQSSNPMFGYNSYPTPNGTGYKQTAEHIEKVASKNRGKKAPPRTPEWRARQSEAHKGQRNVSQLRPVRQATLDGVEIKTFDSVSSAARSIGNIKKSGNIVQALKGRYRQAFGYKWEYA